MTKATQHTGFSDATFGAVCSIIGVDKAGNNAGLHNRLSEIYTAQFQGRESFTIGEVVNAFAHSLVS